MLKQIWQHAILLAVAGLVITSIAACGGGGGNPDPNPVNKTALSGSLTQDTEKAVAAAAGIRDATVTLLQGETVVATVQTTANGKFDFGEIDPGNYTLQFEFQGSEDLDDDGEADVFIFNIPVTILADATVVFNTNIIGVDIDQDGDLDSIDIDSLLTDNKGSNIRRLVRLLHRLGKLQEDTDGDGDIDDEDLEDDVDNDGIPDNAQGSLNSLHGGILRGAIQEVGDDSITVRGIDFEVNNQTKFRDRGNKNVDLDDFDVGDNVHIHARWNGDNWVALMIKTTGQGGGGGNDPDVGVFHGEIEDIGEDSLMIEGREFSFDDDTDFIVAGNPSADIDDFAIGDFVLIIAREVDDEWLATRIVLIKAGEGGDTIQNFTGEISALSAASITVGGQAITLNAQTKFKLADGSATTAAAFSVGDEVTVRARQQGTSWIAMEVKMVEEAPVTDTFSGPITLLSATSLTVEGQAISIDSSTQWKAEDGSASTPDAFGLGDIVTVVAEQQGSTWVAVTVTMTEDLPVTDTFSGLITLLSDTSVTVEGQAIVINEATLWENEDGTTAVPALFHIGDEVSIEAEQQGTTWVATTITLIADNGPGSTTFSGLIEGLTETSITLHGDLVFTLNASTEYQNADGTSADPGLVDIGDFVSVQAHQEGETWIAEVIKLLDDEPVVQNFSGIIDTVAVASLVLHGGAEFALNTETHFMLEDGSDAEFSLFDAGDFVTVQALQDGESWLALHVELTDDEPVIDHFTAPITAITGELITLGSDEFTIDEVSHFMLEDGSDAEASMFDEGDLVTIEARQTGTGWHALHITFLDDNDTLPVLNVFEGSISTITAFQLTVGPSTFTVDAGTKWFLADGSVGTYLDFAVDDDVQVIAEQDGLNWTALKVTMQ